MLLGKLFRNLLFYDSYLLILIMQLINQLFYTNSSQFHFHVLHGECWWYTHHWGFLSFGVRMLFVVPNPARSLMTAIQGYERTYRSATNQMDLYQLGSVNTEWCYSDHINRVIFLKLVFQIYRYKVK